MRLDQGTLWHRLTRWFAVRLGVDDWLESRRLWHNPEWREQIAESEALWAIELESMSNMDAYDGFDGPQWQKPDSWFDS